MASYGMSSCPSKIFPVNQKAKKDALWKPLLRGFRIYLRRTLQVFLDINQIYDKSGDLSEVAQNACRQFIKSVGAPLHVQEDKSNHYGLMIALVPSSTSNLEKFFICVPKMQEEIPKLKPIFSKIFRENSIKLRLEFFSNELIQEIWSQYMLDESHQIRSYIAKLRETQPYQGQVEVLMRDILALSQRLNFQILRPEHFC